MRCLGRLLVGFDAAGDATSDVAAMTTALYDRDYSGHCAAGRHSQCQHSEGGSAWPEGIVIDPCTYDNGVINPGGVWRCGCSCHGRGQVHQRLQRERARLAALEDLHRRRAGASPDQPSLFELADAISTSKEDQP